MSEGSEIVCFHCGQSVGDPPRLNEMPDGEPCRACADRLLDALPPIFHTPIVAPVEGRRMDRGELARIDEHVRADRDSDLGDDQPA